MARTESQKRIAAEPQPVDLTPTSDAAPESLDKVRDILFGGQMRAVEGRLQTLEERLLGEQEVMRAEFAKRIAAVAEEAQSRLQSLGEQLAAERARRAEELKALGGELRDALRTLERRHAKLEELTGTADAELRDSVLEHSRATTAQIERLSQRLTAELSREVQGLRHDKADVASLVGIFTDMAGRLGGALGDGRVAVRDAPRS
jgi:DNA anti-recombination protein RmuC